MSEQAKIAYIQEELKEARRYEMLGYVIGFVMMLVFWLSQGIFQAVSGLVVISCFVISIYYGAKRVKLRHQLRTMTTASS